MRRYPVWFLILALILVLSSCAGPARDEPLRIMTFNIRLNTPDDGPNQWSYRKDMAASMIRFHDADIAGLQEALKDQVDDLAARLPEYGWFGVGRDDGREAGEYMAVFYRSDRVQVLEQSTFWLSETPDSVSKGWDAACFRVVTWGRFEDKRTGKVFYLFNTHFDHIGETARRESVKLLLKRVVLTAGPDPVIVTGDFNSPPGSEPYQVITQGLPGGEAAGLIDTKNVARFPHHGPEATFRGFSPAESPDDKPIDHIFIKNRVRVVFHGTLSDTFDGKFPSDHMPVLAEVIVD